VWKPCRGRSEPSGFFACGPLKSKKSGFFTAITPRSSMRSERGSKRTTWCR